MKGSKSTMKERESEKEALKVNNNFEIFLQQKKERKKKVFD